MPTSNVIPDRVKQPGEEVQVTQEQISEYLKCAEDPVYFMENYMYITGVDEGIIPFEPYEYQKDMIKNYHKYRFNINLLARQSGKTTAVSAYAIYHVIFSERKEVVILANKADTAKDILDRTKKMYEMLPRWLQQGVISWAKQKVELENYSVIKISTTTEDSARGISASLLILDEFAFVRSNIAANFWAAAYPTISSGKKTKVIIISTANGLNTFYKMWQDAIEKRSEFVPYEVKWWDVPGRDEEWKKQTIANLGGDYDRFKIEYENEFLGNSQTLIPVSKLKSISHKQPIKSSSRFSVYEEPKKDALYFATVDVSRGVGNDYSSIQIIDITKFPYRQVAVYRDNQIEPMLFANIIVKWAMSYNFAYLLFEANDIGQSVADQVHQELEYENILFVSHQGRAGQRLGGGFSKTVRSGVYMSQRTKNLGVEQLKTLIMNDQLIISDFATIQEFASFQQKGQSYAAEEGAHDDLVMPLVTFGWAVQEPYFKEISSNNLRNVLEEKKADELLESIPAFGFINDGIDDNDGWQDVSEYFGFH